MDFSCGESYSNLLTSDFDYPSFINDLIRPVYIKRLM